MKQMWVSLGNMDMERDSLHNIINIIYNFISYIHKFLVAFSSIMFYDLCNM